MRNLSITAPTEIAVTFSPNGESEHTLIDLFNSAKESIYLAMYAFTNPKLANSIIEAKKRGVIVVVVMDKGQTRRNQLKIKRKMERNKIEVHLRGGKYHYMHHKFVIVDRKTVASGSYNYTIDGQHSNDENLLFVEFQPIADAYTVEFQRLLSLNMRRKVK